jgi:arsenate reductase-like glutaredoxin family protein
VITLFHKPTAPGSTRILTLLKQANATAKETATEDQASSHDHHSADQRTEFTLDITEAPPTSDQLKNILEYVGSQNAGKIVEGAMTENDALKKLGENPSAFVRPLVRVIPKILRYRRDGRQ